MRTPWMMRQVTSRFSSGAGIAVDAVSRTSYVCVDALCSRAERERESEARLAESEFV